VQRAHLGKMKAWCEDFLEEFDGTVISGAQPCRWATSAHQRATATVGRL
jgi:hypothetical protein